MNTKKAALLLGCTVLAASLTACSGAESNSSSGETITLANALGHTDTEAVTALWTSLLEDREYNIEVVDSDLATAITGVANGDTDAYLNAWLPTAHADYVEAHKDSLVIVEPPFFNSNLQVLVVPDYVEENTIAEVVANADQYGNQIVGLESGSGNMRALPKVVEAYGAQDKLEIVEGSTAAALAALDTAILQGDKVVVSLWTPHGAFASMPIKALEDPLGGWPDSDGSYILTSKSFESDHPEVFGWMSNSKINETQYASLMQLTEEASSPEEGVQQWLENSENKATVDAWFQETDQAS